jgi:DNA invertase Pin-like site-specific DNA recombinase
VIHVGIYVRISDDDRDEHRQLTRAGVKRQETDCRQLAADLGVTVVRVYDDNNITAADERITRPGFEQLLQDLESGTIQGFLFYHADRVARLELDAARMTRLYRVNPRLIGRSVQGGTDLSTEEGRAMFVVQAVMGGLEVAATRRRVTRWHMDLAAAGKNHGGKRPFGWEADRKVLRDWEADLLAKAVREIPLGKTMGMIRREWIAAGVKPTADGKGPLRDATILARITNPRVCGYRPYVPAQERREVGKIWLPDHVLHVNGQPVTGDWQPIVTPEEWRKCVATLKERRMKRPDHGYSRLHARYLLSGIARCGECGSKLYGHLGTRDTIHRYICLEREGGCGGIKRTGPALDHHVQTLFLQVTRQALDDKEGYSVEIDTICDSKIAQLREEIKDVMARRKPDCARKISTSTAMDLVSQLEEEIADLTYKTRALTADNANRLNDATKSLEEWESYTIDTKRERLRRVISAVVVNKTRRGARFDPSCIEVVWAS